MAPRALAPTVARLAKPVLEKNGRDYAALIADWPRIVGDKLAAASLPEKLNRPRNGVAGVTTLTLRVSGGAAMEFQHREPQIIERINAYLGHRAVDRLKLFQAPIPGRAARRTAARRPLTPTEEKQLAESLKGVDDPDLRQRLADLGRALATQK